MQYDSIEIIQMIEDGGFIFQMIAVIPKGNNKVQRLAIGKQYSARNAASRAAHKLSKNISHWYLI